MTLQIANIFYRLQTIQKRDVYNISIDIRNFLKAFEDTLQFLIYS